MVAIGVQAFGTTQLRLTAGLGETAPIQPPAPGGRPGNSKGENATTTKNITEA